MKQFSLKQLWVLFILFLWSGCGSSGQQSPAPGCPPNCPPTLKGILFNPVGPTIAGDLIDLEFLPGQNGEAILIGKDGTVFYLKNDFTPLSSTVSIPVENNGEQGMLNVAADPDYSANKLLYFYYTIPGGGTNRVERRTVTVDVNQGTFSLGDVQTIIEFPKSPDSPNPGTNHNGGSMLFDSQGNMLLGVGDGGGGSSEDKTLMIGQDLTKRLGKIHRIIPNRSPGAGGFSIPNGQSVSAAQPSIYEVGVRNPFTLAFDATDRLFIGDVGSEGNGASGNGPFEEIDLATTAGENFGWPLFEGPGSPSPFVDPIGGYRHGDNTFNDQDPEDNPTGSESIMANAVYKGNGYNGLLTGKLIYSEFFAGWVRLLEVDGSGQPVSDQNIGHLTGLISLHEGADGFLYGASLGASDHILKVELVP
jgi:glucose/arabinose dehydrogenase